MALTRRDAIFREFDRWGFNEKGWSPDTRKRYYSRAMAADRWPVRERNQSLVWASPRNLKAYLFATPPTARNRNNIRQALVGFGEYLVAQGFTEVNPALALPRLPEPASIPKALEPAQAHKGH
jgi:site-specific recombinase XerD